MIEIRVYREGIRPGGRTLLTTKHIYPSGGAHAGLFREVVKAASAEGRVRSAHFVDPFWVVNVW